MADVRFRRQLVDDLYGRGSGAMSAVVLLVLAVVAGFAAASYIGTRRPGSGPAGGHGPTGRRNAEVAARAEAMRWVDRLGAAVAGLDGGDVLAARQALADASERYHAAGAQLCTAHSVTDYDLVRQTALEGLHYIRACRSALGIDPGPELPPHGVAPATGSARIRVGEQSYLVSDRPGDETPYYHPGGSYGGRTVAAGWYQRPWWKTALAAGAGTVGGVLLLDGLSDVLGGHAQGFGGFMGGGPG